MAQSRLGIFARNIFSNFAGTLFTAAVALILTPFIQETLGGPVWAMWSVIVAMTGSYGLLDLGVRSAVGQYVTRYWGQGDMAGVNRTLNTAMVILTGVALLGICVTLGLAWSLPAWVEFEDLAGLDATSMQWALVISGGGISLSLPMALWSTVTYTRERFDISNGIGIAESSLRLGLTFVVCSAYPNIIALAIVMTGTQMLAWLARMWVAYRLMPGLRWSPGLFDRGSVRELFNFGVLNVLVNIADRVVIATDLIIISAVLLAGSVFYANGAVLPPYLMMIVLQVTWTMTPYATKCDARGDRAALQQLFLNGTRGSLYLAAVVSAGLLLTGDEFMRCWLGAATNLDPEAFNRAASAAGQPVIDAAQIESGAIAPAGLILAILTWATLVRASSSCGRQILFGMRRMRLLASLSTAEAVLNLGISIALIHWIGTPGVAIGSLVPVVLLYLLGQNVFLARTLEVPVRALALQIFRAAVPVMAGMYAFDRFLLDGMAADGDWWIFLANAFLLLVPALLIGLFVTMTRDERRKLLERLAPHKKAAT